MLRARVLLTVLLNKTTDSEDIGFELLSSCPLDELKVAGQSISRTPFSIFFNGTDRDFFYFMINLRSRRGYIKVALTTISSFRFCLVKSMPFKNTMILIIRLVKRPITTFISFVKIKRAGLKSKHKHGSWNRVTSYQNLRYFLIYALGKTKDLLGLSCKRILCFALNPLAVANPSL